MYLSRPSIVCPFGDENALFNALKCGKRALVEREFLGAKMLVGAIEFELFDFKNDTKKSTRAEQIRFY